MADQQIAVINGVLDHADPESKSEQDQASLTPTDAERSPYQHLRVREESIKGEIVSLEESFSGLEQDYYLLDKVGEGTFSSVYIAVDLKHQVYNNAMWNPTRFLKPRPTQPYIVAVKRIYVTASPDRIYNELKMLKEISGCKQIVPVVSAIRHKDQVLVVMPYVEHTDFRLFYKRLTMSGIRKYMSELLQGLAFIHEKRIIHRDIKPTNFLFNVKTGTGVIVDLGLAEKEPENNNECICMRSQGVPRYNVRPEGGYKKDDPRPSRRANRAGTRGFRAPEVLFKCLSQTRKIDIWAAGVILLVFFARRFTFFSSADDSEAVIELATLFGKRAMERCANLHGSILETSIPTITEDGYSFEQVILWCNHKNEDVFTRPQKLGIDLLRHCLDPNVRKRPTAHELLQHPFFKEDFGIDNDLEPRESRKRPASHDVDPAIKKSKLNTHQREQKQHQHNEQQQPELGRLQEEQQPQHDDKQQTELDHHRQKKQPFQYDETQLTELDQHQQEEQPLQHDERQQTELDDHQEETQSLQHDKRHQAEVSQFEAPFCERYDGAQAESEPLARRVTNESAHPTQVGSLPGEQSTQADKPQEIEVRQMEEEEVVIHSLAGLEPENEGWEELTA